MLKFLRKFFKTNNEKILHKYDATIQKINSLEKDFSTFNDQEIKEQTALLRKEYNEGSTLDDLLPKAFAIVREASKRTLGLRHFDEQLIGGIALHNNFIAEMKTGEGKTLVATLAAYLNTIPEKGVHVITVNDYLAERDANWMGAIYNFLGLTYSSITHNSTPEERKKAYLCDITYITNNELGFDYLKDNMVFNKEMLLLRPFHFAIIDEIDNILIDEARTPLIISGQAEKSSQLYQTMNIIIPKLKPEHYEKDDKGKSIYLTENGNTVIEKLLTEANLIKNSHLFEPQNLHLVHYINEALRAHHFYHKDQDYIIKDNKIVIIDDFTGRMKIGSRFGGGLHQALEAKERVPIQIESQTLATITYQNLFRLYPKLSGMTGTAETESEEFSSIYNLEVLVIPTHKKVMRKDSTDRLYISQEEKYQEIIKTIEQCYNKKQPCLIGTITIEKSEHISKMLKGKNIPHHVLNAKYHEQEASIIAQSGLPSAVTIATNMAGRGTDIQLGGNLNMLIDEAKKQCTSDKDFTKLKEKIIQEFEKNKKIVIDSGGLFVLGTERHDSRRIDNQLRGRSGRQGDPGESLFFLSFKDEIFKHSMKNMDTLIKRFGADKHQGAISYGFVSRQIEKAQKQRESLNYEIRKQLLKFDDIMNHQRKVIFEQRYQLLLNEDISETIKDMFLETVNMIVSETENNNSQQEIVEHIEKECTKYLNLSLPIRNWAKNNPIGDQELVTKYILDAALKKYKEKEKTLSIEYLHHLEKNIIFRNLDFYWKNHLKELDNLRDGIHLRGHGQRNPLQEYQQEALALFEHMLNQIIYTTIQLLSFIDISNEDQELLDELLPDEIENQKETHQNLQQQNTNTIKAGKALFKGEIVGRNKDCPCGSGRKFKHCCGR